jgi:peptidoglycan hydrolase-like protein with peptidoglycan-binding domain
MLNGRLPKAVLGPIYHGRLRKDAARAWQAMHMEARGRYGTILAPLGPMSSYRTYAEQVYLWNHGAHPHNTTWVARPGTSNHGWGLAVDLGSRHMRTIVDSIGAKYGWAKRWSDAPNEWWHIKWRSGVWNGKAPFGYRIIRRNSRGRDVLRLKKLMHHKGLKGFSRLSPVFGPQAVAALKRYQRAQHIKADGIAGPSTWYRLQT